MMKEAILTIFLLGASLASAQSMYLGRPPEGDPTYLSYESYVSHALYAAKLAYPDRFATTNGTPWKSSMNIRVDSNTHPQATNRVGVTFVRYPDYKQGSEKEGEAVNLEQIKLSLTRNGTIIKHEWINCTGRWMRAESDLVKLWYVDLKKPEQSPADDRLKPAPEE